MPQQKNSFPYRASSTDSGVTACIMCIRKGAFLALLLNSLLGAAALANTVTAASCSQSDVQAAINSASSGDTVSVPGGSCTWSSTVSISSSHQITLSGGGTTTITWGGGYLSIVAGTSNNTRVTGFTFNGSYTNGDCPIGIITSSSPLSLAFRFDHNTLDGGNPSAPATFACVQQDGPGLFDHNSFTTHRGADEMIHLLGNGAGNTTGWTDSVPPGGANMIYIEDNSFKCTNATVGSSALQSYYGARTVARNNTLTNAGIDQHGGGGVGARWWEFYGNTFTAGDNICIRAGSGVIWGNSGTGSVRMLQEGGTYPANYQVGRGQNENLTPAYVWNNGGTAILLNTTTGCAVGEANMVQFQRDVYADSGNGLTSGTLASMPSSCSTNTAYWATDRNTLYKCTSNTWTAYYAPYPYPHPLTLGTSLVPPSNLQATPH